MKYPIPGRTIFPQGIPWEMRAERRPRPDSWDDFWYETQPYESSAGIDVNEDSALRFGAVWACVKVISEDLASLPLIIYERDGKLKRRAPENAVYNLLHDAPNDEMSSLQFREALQAHLLLWGNAYAEIQRNGRGHPFALWPLDPSRMKLRRNEADELEYEYRLHGTAKEPKIFQKHDILHIAGLGFNGLIGYSVISYHREAIGVGLAAQEFEGNNFRNGARLSVALVHPATRAPNPEARAAFRKELHKDYAGPQNAGKMMTLWEGMEPKPFSMSMHDAQFIESRKFSRAEIAGIFRVPPHKIMDLERATFSNIENQDIDYAKSTIRPWAVRWEQAIKSRLLDNSPNYYAEHLVDGLMRGDIKSRYGAYAVGRQWGWLSVNDIRGLENMNPIPGGDEYLRPLNMVPVGEDPETAEDDEPTQDEIKAASIAMRRLRLIRS